MADRGSFLRRFLSALFFLLVLVEHIPSALAEDGHCIWYGVCANSTEHKMMNCFYDGPAKPIEEKAMKIIEQYCPEIAKGGYSCCNYEQLNQLKVNIALAENLLGRCPTCFQNFLKPICGMACAVDQSKYLKPVQTEQFNGTHRRISEIDYYLSKTFMDGIYNSCSEVKLTSTNERSIKVMCGQWGDACSAQRWFDNMGDASNYQVPFQINYKATDVPVDGYTPYAPIAEPCNVGTKVNLLINNAGVVSGHYLLETPDHLIQRTFDVNILAHFWTVKAFLPTMISQNDGHIVTIASMAGHVGVAKLVDYCSSKAAACGFDEALRVELETKGVKGVKTSLICPYFIRSTGMFEEVNSRFVPQLNSNEVADRVVLAIRTSEPFALIPGFFRVLLPFKWIVPWPCISELIRGLVPDAVPVAPNARIETPSSAPKIDMKTDSRPMSLLPPARHDRQV